mmetsp:Transcript_22694/g.71380  ORF Transcript_22694/g.71380 Transcript_22694/m.71380 type:complete len:328 (+) Transcript_22694:761-1744(+)
MLQLAAGVPGLPRHGSQLLSLPPQLLGSVPHAPGGASALAPLGALRRRWGRGLAPLGRDAGQRPLPRGGPPGWLAVVEQLRQRAGGEGALLQPLLVEPLPPARRQRPERRQAHPGQRPLRHHGLPGVRGRPAGPARRAAQQLPRGPTRRPRHRHRLPHGCLAGARQRPRGRGGGPAGAVLRPSRCRLGPPAPQAERPHGLRRESPRAAAGEYGRQVWGRGHGLQPPAARRPPRGPWRRRHPHGRPQRRRQLSDAADAPRALAPPGARLGGRRLCQLPGPQLPEPGQRRQRPQRHRSRPAALTRPSQPGRVVAPPRRQSRGAVREVAP